MKLLEIIIIYIAMLPIGMLIGFQIGINFWHWYTTRGINQSDNPKPTLPTIWRWLHRH